MYDFVLFSIRIETGRIEIARYRRIGELKTRSNHMCKHIYRNVKFGKTLTRIEP